MIPLLEKLRSRSWRSIRYFATIPNQDWQLGAWLSATGWRAIADLWDEPAERKAAPMIVKFEDGKELRISFQYAGDATVCRCRLGENEYSAVATRSPRDQFIKAVGRRVALTRFLKMGCLRLELDGTTGNFKWVCHQDFSRAIRSKVWTAYFSQHSDLKHKAQSNGARA